MILPDIIDSRAVLCNVRTQSKKSLLLEISQALAGLTGLEARTIFEALNTREKLGSTGLGQGIALPHGRLSGLTRVYGLFAKLAAPIAFDSIDGEPVDLVFALLAPTHAGADHLTALAKVSRLLRDSRTLAKLRGTDTPEGIFAILTEPPATASAA